MIESLCNLKRERKKRKEKKILVKLKQNTALSDTHTPEITGWMLLSTMVTPRRPAILLTALCKSLSLVKMTGKHSLNTNIPTMLRRPIASEVPITTMTAYIVALGLPAPSSFETRTLKQNHIDR